MATTLDCDVTNPMDSKRSSTTRRRFQKIGRPSNLRRSSLFSLYAKIFRLLLSKWDKPGGCFNETSEEDEYSSELDQLVLPSNEEWRLRVYYRLVELQRENDLHSEEEVVAEEEAP